MILVHHTSVAFHIKTNFSSLTTIDVEIFMGINFRGLYDFKIFTGLNFVDNNNNNTYGCVAYHTIEDGHMLHLPVNDQRLPCV